MNCPEFNASAITNFMVDTVWVDLSDVYKAKGDYKAAFEGMNERSRRTRHKSGHSNASVSYMKRATIVKGHNIV
jgi:hypothetical protein